MSEIRDLERLAAGNRPQRATTENITLKQRLRQLTHDDQTLEECLHAARSNNRFADRRIAQLADHAQKRPDAPGTSGSLVTALRVARTPGSRAAQPHVPNMPAT